MTPPTPTGMFFHDIDSGSFWLVLLISRKIIQSKGAVSLRIE